MNILKIKRALAELVWTGALLFAAASVGAAFSQSLWALYPASRQKITQSPGTKQTLLLKALLIGAFFLPRNGCI